MVKFEEEKDTEKYQNMPENVEFVADFGLIGAIL